MKHAGVPSVGVSLGGNQASESIAPLDWGGHIPLWHIERHAPDTPVVVVSPARDLDANAHAEAAGPSFEPHDRRDAPSPSWPAPTRATGIGRIVRTGSPPSPPRSTRAWWTWFGVARWRS